MHPGAVCGGPVSSQFSVKELNPHGQASVASQAFRDPRLVAAASRHMVSARQEWVQGELDDAAAVVASGALSREARNHGRQQLGLSGSGQSGDAQLHSTQHPAAAMAASRHHHTRPAHPRPSNVGTSFVRRPEFAYESTYQSSFTTFAAFDAAAAHAAVRLAAQDLARAQRRAHAQLQSPGDGAAAAPASSGGPVARAPQGGWPV